MQQHHRARPPHPVDFVVLVTFILVLVLSTLASLDLPLFPSEEKLAIARSEFTNKFNGRGKKCEGIIPCNLWSTAKTWSPIPDHMNGLIRRNPQWDIHLISDDEMTRFMNDIFGGTKILWAFNLINPQIGPAKADIWRMAVLWLYGGVYMNSDADILSPLSDVIMRNDSFLFGTENNKIIECWANEKFHLNQAISQSLVSFGNHQVILQWLLASSPGHPFLSRTLENIVELVGLEHHHRSVFARPNDKSLAFRIVICTTGPMVFTASIYEIVNQQNSTLINKAPYRYVGADFAIYNGRFKVDKWEPKRHYTTIMAHKKMLLLNDYAQPEVGAAVGGGVEKAAIAAAAASDEKPRIVYISLGKKMAHYLTTAVVQARLFNSNTDIFIVASKEAIMSNSAADKQRLSSANIRLVTTEELPVSVLHARFRKESALDRRFRGGFWFFAMERFFYLESLMTFYNMANVFHLEGDNMLYANVTEFLPKLIALEHGLASTFDTDDRVVPGFVYIRSTQALSKLLEHIANTSDTGLNDMDTLAAYKNKANGSLGLLPVVPCSYVEHVPLINSYNVTAKNKYSFCDKSWGFIFDAAALGQYLGGVNPKNLAKHAAPWSSIGYASPSSFYDPALFDFEWRVDSEGRLVPFLIFHGEEFRIVNLHIHCKQCDMFYSRRTLLETNQCNALDLKHLTDAQKSIFKKTACARCLSSK